MTRIQSRSGAFDGHTINADTGSVAVRVVWAVDRRSGDLQRPRLLCAGLRRLEAEVELLPNVEILVRCDGVRVDDLAAVRRDDVVRAGDRARSSSDRLEVVQVPDFVTFSVLEEEVLRYGADAVAVGDLKVTVCKKSVRDLGASRTRKNGINVQETDAIGRAVIIFLLSRASDNCGASTGAHRRPGEWHIAINKLKRNGQRLPCTFLRRASALTRFSASPFST